MRYWRGYEKDPPDEDDKEDTNCWIGLVEDKKFLNRRQKNSWIPRNCGGMRRRSISWGGKRIEMWMKVAAIMNFAKESRLNLEKLMTTTNFNVS